MVKRQSLALGHVKRNHVQLSKSIDLPNLRWELFTASQAEAQKLTPTKAALLQHILWAVVWAHLEDPKPDLPPADGYGWKEQSDTYIPVITTLDPAPKAVVELVHCNCTTVCSTARCTCRKAYLVCTELCKCSFQADNCENHADNSNIMVNFESDSEGED